MVAVHTIHRSPTVCLITRYFKLFVFGCFYASMILWPSTYFYIPSAYMKIMKILLCFAAFLGFTGSEDILDRDTFGMEICFSEPSDNFDDWEKEIAALPFQNLDRVLVCLNEEATDQMRLGHSYTDLRPKILTEFPNLNIEYHPTVLSCQEEIKYDENNQTKTILSVIVPEPLEESFSEIPMYYYDTLHVYEEQADTFPNGLVPHQRQWHLLKHAFMHYIKAHEWTRIAIVSDNSPNSQEFESELEQQMEGNKLVFNIQRCEGETCDFLRALQFLKDHGAVILIANVEGQHAWDLVNTAQRLKMTSTQYLWLVRGPFKGLKAFQNVISITLSPTLASNIPEHFVKTPHLNSILWGLKLIFTAVDSVKEKERIAQYYRSIFKKMNDTHCHDKATAFLRSGSSDFIQMLFIEDSSTKISYQKGSDAPMYDLEEYCLLRTESFTSPCSDTWAVLICIVWLKFILIVFLLVYFFNRCLVWT